MGDELLEPGLTLDRPFADGLLALRVSVESQTFPFVDFAQALVDEHRGAILERVGALGTDEVYWNIQIDGRALTLHSQHYLGVFLCAADEASEDLLRALVPFVQQYFRRRQRASLENWVAGIWRRLRALVDASRRSSRRR